MKLLKTMVVLTLVVGLLLGGVLPAQADNGKPPWAEGKVEVIRGVVTSVGENEIEVAGETIIVDETTKIRVPTLGKEASLEDIEVGMQIVAQAYRAEENGTLHARHIVVIPARPVYGHHVGKLLECDEEAGIIRIEDRWGNEVAFDIDADNFKKLPPGVDMEEAVDEQRWVTVITRGHPMSGSRIAIGVVVHPISPVLGKILRVHLRGLEHASGTITVDETNELITIDSTELDYDGSTIFILRGVPSVQGQSGIVFYKDELAKVVLVRVEPSEIEED